MRLPAGNRRAEPDADRATTPESYLGYQHLQNLDGQTRRGRPARPPTSSRRRSPRTTWDCRGTWTIHAEEATAGGGAQLELSFLAKDVYLVMGGSGTVDVCVDGHHTQTFTVSGIPRLYTLYQSGPTQLGHLQLQFSPGVQAYDFTFG